MSEQQYRHRYAKALPVVDLIKATIATNVLKALNESILATNYLILTTLVRKRSKANRKPTKNLN